MAICVAICIWLYAHMLSRSPGSSPWDWSKVGGMCKRYEILTQLHILYGVYVLSYHVFGASCTAYPSCHHVKACCYCMVYLLYWFVVLFSHSSRSMHGADPAMGRRCFSQVVWRVVYLSQFLSLLSLMCICIHTYIHTSVAILAQCAHAAPTEMPMLLGSGRLALIRHGWFTPSLIWIAFCCVL